MIDYSALEKAIAQLETSLGYTQSNLAKSDPQLAVQFRSASIQAFEYTYELSHKLLKRYLESTDPSPERLDAMNFQDLIRTGAEKGMLQNSWDKWQLYRKARGITSHTYNEVSAVEVFALIPAFLAEAQFLCNQFRQRTR
jgi:nucleotidyltransferase substrate binding protein (TIGR01987 family)